MSGRSSASWHLNRSQRFEPRLRSRRRASDSPSTTESRQDETDTALLLVEITEKSTPTLSAITHMAAAYQSAVSLEIAAVLRGDPQAASGLHIALGDPAFTALDAELATVGRAEASNAADGVTAAFIASIGIVSGSGSSSSCLRCTHGAGEQRLRQTREEQPHSRPSRASRPTVRRPFDRCSMRTHNR